MFGLSISHLLLVLLILLLLGGARKLPELGSSLGKGLRAFKRGIEGVEDEDAPQLNAKDSEKADSKTRKS